MDPEEIDATVPPGTPVEHRDGHSVVHTAAGPVTVAHRRGRTTLFADDPAALLPARGGAVAPAPRGRVPRSPHRIDFVDPVTQAGPEAIRDVELATRMREQGIAQRQAYEQAQRHGTMSAPDRFGIVTRTYPDGRTERTGPPGAFEAERAALAPSGGSVTTTTPTSSVTTDAHGRVMPSTAIPSGTPAEWLTPQAAAQQSMEDRLRGTAHALSAEDAAMQPAAPDAGPVMQTIQQGGIPEAPPAPAAAPQAPVAPSVASRPARVGGGGIGRAPEPMTAPQALEMLAGTPEAQQGFDSLIGGLAQGHAGRRAPTLIDQQEQLGLRHAGAQQRDVMNTQAALQQQAQQRAQLEEQRQAALANAQRAYQRSIDRVAQARLDPSRWFRDQGAGGTVGAVIATALGAVGAALQGSDHNWGLEQINQAVERDLQAQQSEIDSARATADLTGNMLNITRQEFSDRQAAMDAAHANMLDQVALQLQAMEADIASDEARVAAEQLRQQIAAEAAQAQQEAEQRQAEIDATRAHTAYDLARAQGAAIDAARNQQRLLGMGQGTPTPPTTTGPQLETYDRLLAGGVTPEQAAMDVWGPEWSALFPGGAPQSTNTAEQRAAYDALDSSLATLERIANANPDDIPGIGVFDSRVPAVTDAQRVMRDEIDNAVDLMGRLRSGAAISEDEFTRFRGILGAAGTEAQFRAGLARIRREIAARLGRQARGSTAVARDDAEVGFSPE